MITHVSFPCDVHIVTLLLDASLYHWFPIESVLQYMNGSCDVEETCPY